MKILGIETSCDETAASVAVKQGEKIEILSNIISSQIDIHKKYGGVIPELAAREHVLNILPVIDKTLKKAKIKQTDIDAIAVTKGPGLITSLITGIETAKTLAYAWKKPIIEVNHIEGHIYANFIENSQVNFPALILTVSGGHTMLVLMSDHGKYKLVGETRDDAAGEAFDKVAKFMGLEYPGGPIISARAEEFLKSEEENKIELPRPMMGSNDFDFSFSGLKTSLLYTIKKDKNYKKRINNYCYEFQQAIIDVLIHKTIKAASKFEVKTIMLAGGVSASRQLREQLNKRVKNDLDKIDFFMPNLKYTTDNAAMIATAGVYKFLRKDFISWQDLKVDCNLELINWF